MTGRMVLRLMIWGIVIAIATSTSGETTDERPQNIILIGWDGAQRDHIKECLDREELPNLRQLSSEGALVAIDILRTTDTKAGWTQILTGYVPEATRVFSNSRYQPIPKGYTVFERLEEFFGPDEFATWAVIGKKGNVGADPPVCRAITGEKQNKAGKKQRAKGLKIFIKDGKKYRSIPGKPFFHARESMDFFINGLMEDEKVGSKALELIEQHREKPFFAFVHFAEMDHQGHRYGENSREYNDALISADFWTGRIVEKLKELAIYDQTLIYITADHGFDEGMKAHRDAPYVFLATNDPQVRCRGERADIAATILARFGLDLNRIDPPLDGHPLTEPLEVPLW